MNVIDYSKTMKDVSDDKLRKLYDVAKDNAQDLRVELFQAQMHLDSLALEIARRREINFAIDTLSKERRSCIEDDL